MKEGEFSMKIFLAAVTLAIHFLFVSNSVFAVTETKPKEELFSTKGTIIEINLQEKVLHVKNEGGLELTYHADEATPLDDFAVNDFVEMDYLYNQDYEKMIRNIKKSSPPAPK